tara:strand:+ start:377 stop:853 length:477 start_codon:yes stop_codon:yes gene_type:complete
LRVGFGYDAHRLVSGKGVTLGGIFIECEYSIKAHSDGDLIIHALIDSLLGASALGDIGTFFPSESSDYKDISSQLLLSKVIKLLNEEDYQLVNVDVTLIAQVPKLKDHIESIRVNLSKVLGIDKENLSCKATTTDGLGFEGKKKGISCTSICLLKRRV